MKNTSTARLPLKLWSVVIALLLIAPTLVVIPLAFTDKRSFKFPIEGFSMQWFERFFTHSIWLESLFTSLFVAVVTALIATTVGTLAALAFARAKGRVFEWLRATMMLPIVIPGIVVAVGMFGMYLTWGLSGSHFGIILAHIMLAIPFVLIPVMTAMQGLDPTLERAAAVLGANARARFFQVQLPAILPGVATGFVFAFVTSLDEVVIAYFLQSPSVKTLPVQMYNSVTVSTDPTIAVASTLVLVASTLIILIPRLVLIARARRKTAS